MLDLAELQSVLLAMAPVFAAAAVALLLEAVFPWRKVAMDGLRWVTAIALSLCGWALINLTSPFATLISAEFAQRNEFGLFHAIDLPLWLTVPVGVIGIDFSIFASHLAMHKIPLLWKFHRVHHSDEHLDASTTFLFHPIDMMITTVSGALVVLLLGLPPLAVAIGFGMHLIFSFWQHANVRALPFQRSMSHVIMTPELHRLHHSTNPDHYNQNYAALFTFWDLLFRTLRPSRPGDGDLSFGLDSLQWTHSRTLFSLLAAPFRR